LLLCCVMLGRRTSVHPADRKERLTRSANKHSSVLCTSSACSSQRNLMVQSTTSLSSSIFRSDGNTWLLLFARTLSTLAHVYYTRLHFFFSSAFLNLSAMRIYFATRISSTFNVHIRYFCITHSSRYLHFF